MAEFEKLNLSALDGMNIPEIPLDPKNDTELGQEEIDEIKEGVINEVESLNEFITVIPKDDENQEDSQEEGSEEQDQEIPKGDKNQSQEDEVSLIKGIAEYLKSEKVFDYKDEDFEDSTDFILKKINEVAEAKADEKLKEYPEVIHELAKNYKEGVPLDYLIESKSREIEYNQIKVEDLSEDKELQKKLVSDWLIAQEYDQEDIDKKISKYDDALILEDEAVTALKKLKAYEQKYQETLKQAAKQKADKDKQDYLDQVKGIEKDIEDAPEIIPGLALSKEEKKKIFEAYTKTDSKGETQLIKKLKQDPKAWLKITQFMVLMDGNLDSVKTKLNTQVAKQAKQTVQTYKETTGLSKINMNTVKKAMERIKKNS